MSASQAKLTDAMREKFPSKIEGDSLKLEAGVYQVTGFRVVDSEKFEKIAYIDTADKKQYRTTSKNIVGSLVTTVGKTIEELLKTHASVEMEIVPHKANTGRWGLAIKAF